MKRIYFPHSPGLKIILLVSAALLSLSALANVTRVRRAAGLTEQPPPVASSTARQARRSRGGNVALQPEAYRLSRRLGLRFREAGREVSVLSGTLTFDGESRRVVIRRERGEAGETLEVALGGGAATHAWDDRGGARHSGREAEGEERLLVERLALDSPDQFVLAQTRGASYHTVARLARPDEGGADGYAGPLYDVVRVDEPRGVGGAAPASPWRIYHLNSETGLPEKVSYEEGGGKIEVTLSGWAGHGGELHPSRVAWKRNGSPLMELVVTNVSHGPGQ
jgi:hypothetical protein